MVVVSSKNNANLTADSKLKDKKYRDDTGLFLLCGKKLLEEAVLSGLEITKLYVTEAFYGKNKELVSKTLLKYPLCAGFLTEEGAFGKLTDEKSPEGVCAVAKKPETTEKVKDFTVICDNVSDPANVGAVLRSARAFGADFVYLSKGCADLYSNKVLRAAMGAAFCKNTAVEQDTKEVIKKLQKGGFTVYAAALHTDAVSLSDVDFTGKTAVVIGNEGQGLPDEIIKLCDKALFIEMEPECESLNASVAASVIMYRVYSYKRK